MRRLSIVLIAMVAFACADPRTRIEEELQEAAAFEREGRFADAIIKYRRVLQLDARHAAAFAELVRLYRATGRPSDALSAARAWMDAAPGSREARFARIDLLMQQRDANRARRLAEDLASRGDVEAIVRVGDALVALGRLDEAQRRADEAARLEPGHVGAAILAADVTAARAAAEAETLYRQAADLDANNAAAHTAYGDFLYASGRLRDAEGQFRAALAAAPGDERANRGLANVLLETDRAEVAEPFFQRAAASPRQTLDSNLAYADYLRHRGRTEDARRWLNQLVEAGAHVPRARVRLAALDYDAGEHASAHRLLDSAVRAAAHPEAWLLKASFLHRERRSREALEAVDEALKIAPRSAQAHYVAGVLHEELQEWWKAQRAFTRIRTDRRFGVPATLRLAEVALAARRPLDALQAIDTLPREAATQAEARALRRRARAALGY